MVRLRPENAPFAEPGLCLGARPGEFAEFSRRSRIAPSCFRRRYAFGSRRGRGPGRRMELSAAGEPGPARAANRSPAVPVPPGYAGHRLLPGRWKGMLDVDCRPGA